jgi:hypothetical protein
LIILVLVIIPTRLSVISFHLGHSSQLIKSKEIMEILQTKIEERKKKVRRPDILQAYVNLMYAEIETLQSVVAEIYGTEGRKEFIKQHQEHKEKKNVWI